MNLKQRQTLIAAIILLAFNNGSTLFTGLAIFGSILIYKIAKETNTEELKTYSILLLVIIASRFISERTISGLLGYSLLIILGGLLLAITYQTFKTSFELLSKEMPEIKFELILRNLMIVEAVVLFIFILPIYSFISTSLLAISIATLYLNPVFQSIFSLMPLIIKYIILRPVINYTNSSK